MFKQWLFAAALVGCFQSCCHAVWSKRAPRPLKPRAAQSQAEANRAAEALLDEITAWLTSTFDLPAAADHPDIAFVSQSRLAALRAEDRAFARGLPPRMPRAMNRLRAMSLRFMTTS